MKKLLQKLKELNLPEGEFAIFGSGPVCIRKLRETEDLDVIVTKSLFDQLESRGGLKAGVKEFDNIRLEYLEKDGLEFYKGWYPGDWDIDKLICEAEMIDGFPYVKLEEVLKWKKLKGREKDIKDIKLIEDFLKR